MVGLLLLVVLHVVFGFFTLAFWEFGVSGLISVVGWFLWVCGFVFCFWLLLLKWWVC